jgi:hypothetical protein
MKEIRALEAKAAALSSQFSAWSARRDAYLEVFEAAEEITPEAFDRAATDFLPVQNEILGFFVSCASTRDRWASPTYWIAGHGQALYRRSLTQDTDYEFGVFSGEFLVQTNLVYPGHLKSVPDEFWDAMVEAQRYGTFVFQENAAPTYSGAHRPTPAVLAAGRSNIYKLIRSALVLEQWDPDSLGDLGWLETTWPTTTSWDRLLVEGANAFRAMHRMNYLLYRVDYLRRQGAKRARAAARQSSETQ